MFLQHKDNINIQEKIKKNVPLSNFTTFKVGGPCDYFIEVENEDVFAESILWAIKNNIPYFILGRGANVLVSDDGYRGLIIYTAKFNKITEADGDIYAQSGVLIDDFVDYASSKSLKGLEFLAGMPGTVGGAVYMNARAYKGEISRIINNAIVISVDSKENNIEKITLTNKEMRFSYKNSIFQEKSIYLLEAGFTLKRGNKKDIRNKILEIRALRRRKGEYLFPSAGCIFKNDYNVGRSSGRIIDECDLKGSSVGNAEVYDRHANFIINKGGARAEDIYKLIKIVEKEVKEKTGIKLKREIILLGFDN